MNDLIQSPQLAQTEEKKDINFETSYSSRKQHNLSRSKWQRISQNSHLVQTARCKTAKLQGVQIPENTNIRPTPWQTVKQIKTRNPYKQKRENNILIITTRTVHKRTREDNICKSTKTEPKIQSQLHTGLFGTITTESTKVPERPSQPLTCKQTHLPWNNSNKKSQVLQHQQYTESTLGKWNQCQAPRR